MKTTVKRLRDLKVGVRDLIMISPKDIAIEKGHNPRNYHLPENKAHLAELKASIKAIGVQVPLLVRWDAAVKQAVLVDGECRLQACLELVDEGVEIIGVPTVQVNGGNEADRLITALTANTGKPLSKWEIGGSFQKLFAFGWDAEKIASKTGYTTRYITECMELSDAPDDVKQLLSLEAVTPSLALQHIRTNGSAAGATLTEKVTKARAKNPNAKKVTAKRERKQTGIRLTDDAAEIVIKALKAGAKSDNDRLSEQCAKAIEAIDAAQTK